MATETGTPEAKAHADVAPETTDDSAPGVADAAAASGDAVECSGDATEGHTDDALAARSSAPNGEAESAEDKEGEAADAADAAAAAAETPAADNAVDPKSASASKKTSNGKRKSGGVPEHKNKKPNKRKSTAAKATHLDAEPGELYMARLKSYPPWPAIICDEEMLPTSLINTRPVTTKKADGTYNEAYADGGKKAHERTFPVMFLGTNEFAWIHNTGLAELKAEDCKDVSEKGKNRSLMEAYKIAAEGYDLQHFKNVLLDHAKFMEEEEALKAEEEAEKAEKEAEKAQKAAKKKRKSEAKAQDDDGDGKDADEVEAAPKSAKKRKKAAETDDEEPEKPAKTAKTTKLKLTTNKTAVGSEKKSKDKPAKAKADKKKAQAAAAPEDEEMADAPEPEPEAAVDPEEARKAREREVLFLRHKLQKGFLSRVQAPQEDDMPQMSNYIKKLENYQDLEPSIVRGTKINKVLKALLKLNTIPKDEEFNFRKRSVELLGKWKILGAEPHDTDAADKESKDTRTTNGVNGEASAEESKLAQAEEKPAADQEQAQEQAQAQSGELAAASADDDDETAAAKDENPAAADPPAAGQESESAAVEPAEAVKADA